MKLIVNHAQRYAKMRAHTTAHLLHAELAKIFPQTKQAGSQVDSDTVRFDFYAERLLTLKEIAEIENNINQIIYSALPVKTTETSFDEAAKLGAKAFFEDKYGDLVRVVQVQGETENVSVELCGGTHVENTKDIGCFVILSQEAVASGIKRISAITGPKVSEKVHETQAMLDITVEKLGIQNHIQIADRLEKIMKDYEDLQKKMQEFEIKNITQGLSSAKAKDNAIFDKIINISTDQNLKDFDFKTIVFQAKALFEKDDVLLYTQDGNYAILTPTAESSAKIVAQDLGLKGGGSDTLVQGRDPKVLEIVK